MAGIFISYRRDDSRHAAGRLADDLAAAFGAQSIFRDVESIAPGVDFEVALDQALANCAVMLVVIGPRWATITDREGRRRLDQPNDWIRMEVARALARNVRLIPVMLEDTPLPDVAALPEDLRGLVRRQALPLSDGRWKGDLARLVETLERIPGLDRIGPRPPPPPPPPEPAAKPKAGLWTGVALGAGGLLLLGYMAAESPSPATDKPTEPVVQQSPAAPVQQTAPAPAPAPQAAAPPAMVPPQQLAAVADRVLDGIWQGANDPSTRFMLRQQGAQVQAELSGGGQTFVRGQGQFDGQRLVIDLQFEIDGQPLVQSRCSMMWLPGQNQLQGPCQSALGTQFNSWVKVGNR